ncbi:MAG: T9SS C-terminal target domain-containing protein [Luteolibacter sp.]
MALLLGLPAVQAGELKVDINRDTKNLDSVTEVGFVKWSADTTGGATSGTAAATKSFTTLTGESVSVSFSQTATSAANGGTGLLTNWYQTGAQGTARLVSDGFTVAPANLATGGEIQMSVTGLSVGHHTILTYHNHWDALTAGSLGPMDVRVNGTLVIDNLQPTIRAATNPLTPISYVEFDVAGPATVTTLLFTAEISTAPAVTIKNVVINGFEIDTPNSTRIANTPVPNDGDEHVNADTGNVTLSWSPATAGSAVSHNIYFGTDTNAVKNATTASAEFKGNQTASNYQVAGISSMLTYYWRVDEIDSVGNATKGTVWYFRPRHIAFPGAEGYGRFARGGRGGVVVEVTNLNDGGPGSLRDALSGNYGPRTVVFGVSGLITLESALTISSPYITLAGQTAPGKGICVRKYALGMSGANDNIIRHVRSRPGNIAGVTLNGSGMAGCNHTIMDHCSISWGIDEEMSTRTSKNVTLQRVLISEALNIAGHQNYPAGTEHGYAATIGGDVGSFHHNLLAHNEGRNWSMGGGLDAAGYFSGRLDIFNNVVYNWGHRTTDGGAHEVNFVNNYYKPGAASDQFYGLIADYGNFPGTQQYYVSGNVMPGHFDESTQTLARTARGENGGSPPTTYSPWVSTPFFPSYATVQSAGDAYKIVLSDVGCSQPMIDDHDIRVITETKNGTYTYTGTGPYGGSPGLPNSQNDVGGWENYFQETRPANWDTDHDGMPDWWESIQGFNPNSTAGNFTESNSDADGDGYTALENYLNWMAEPHGYTAPGNPLRVDLAPFAKGFTGAVFSLSAPLNGTVALTADAHTVLFTPSNAFSGVAGFSFTISAGGTTVTRQVGIAVSSHPLLAERRWLGGNIWDTTSGNWLNGSVVGAYQNGNAVIFDDAGVVNPVIQITGVLNPSSITVKGSTPYVFTGGGSLTVSGNITNSGTTRFSGTLPISLAGTWTNQGTLDFLTYLGNPPPGIVNVSGGTIIYPTDLRILQSQKSGISFQALFHLYNGHTYQLQKSASLGSGTWQNVVGQSKTGDGSDWTFSDSSAGSSKSFYRISASTP